jgi:AraC family transcriptional regulator
VSDPTPARAEYLARIHRVQDHVERHLAEELRLEDLARVACFSPFHFSRVYAAVTGESVREFVLRLRLERAASQLRLHQDRSVTEIALDCGFGGPAAFARAFRAAFGLSATQFRKKCKAVRKRGEEPEDGPGYLLPVGAAPDVPEAAGGRVAPMRTRKVKAPEAVRVEDLPATTVAYVRHVGPYAGDVELFGRLFGRLGQWAGPRGLLGPQSRWLTIYHDDPNVTAPERLRISACVTVPPGTAGERDVSVMELPAGRCVVAHFTLHPREYEQAWNWLMGEWLTESGYQPDDRPCYEVYRHELDAPVHLVDLVQPVRPL